MSTNRLEAFSDGVFAIAITLLVLEFRVPASDGAQVGGDLLKLWPSFLAYIVSFGTLGVIWVNHHAVVDKTRGADRALLFLNLLLMATVAFIPFPTSVLAQHLLHDGEQVAAAFYAASLLMMAIGFALVTRHAIRAGLMDAPAYRAPRRMRVVNLGLILYPVAIAVAFLSPLVSVALCIAVAVYYALPPRPSDSREP
jgi:uncharacterized membrane protein